MKKTIKKTLAIILAILMITATAPMVFATDAVAELDVTGTVYIPSSSTTVTVTFTPDETGEYVIISDNGGNDAEIDPYVYILDDDVNQIAFYDYFVY